MVIGAALVLLVAGASPVLGTPAVYHSGLMLLLGILTALLCFWGGLRLASGKRAQFIFGSVSTYFVVSGLIVAWTYGGRVIEYAGYGGAMWFGAIGMACTMVIGILFAAIFGFFVLKLMSPRLWLAGLHWSCAFIIIGSMINYCYEKNAYIPATVGSNEKITSVTTETGEQIPLEFSIQVTDFAVDYYDDDATPGQRSFLITENNGQYSLHCKFNGQWQELPGRHFTIKDNHLCIADLKCDLTKLQPVPNSTQRALLITEPYPCGLAENGNVKEYRAYCTIDTDHRGRPETRKEVLRVNYPIACKDWQIYLLDYQYNPIFNKVFLTLQARKAPGRWFAMVGMVGVIICSACWCWWRRKKTSNSTGKEEQNV